MARQLTHEEKRLLHRVYPGITRYSKRRLYLLLAQYIESEMQMSSRFSRLAELATDGECDGLDHFERIEVKAIENRKKAINEALTKYVQLLNLFGFETKEADDGK